SGVTERSTGARRDAAAPDTRNATGPDARCAAEGATGANEAAGPTRVGQTTRASGSQPAESAGRRRHQSRARPRVHATAGRRVAIKPITGDVHLRAPCPTDHQHLVPSAGTDAGRGAGSDQVDPRFPGGVGAVAREEASARHQHDVEGELLRDIGRGADVADVVAVTGVHGGDDVLGANLELLSWLLWLGGANPKATLPDVVAIVRIVAGDSCTNPDLQDIPGRAGRRDRDGEGVVIQTILATDPEPCFVRPLLAADIDRRLIDRHRLRARVVWPEPERERNEG